MVRKKVLKDINAINQSPLKSENKNAPVNVSQII